MAKRKHDDWLDVPAVMKRLGLSKPAVYKAVETGRLKARKVEVTRVALRIDPASVATFIVSKSHQKSGKRAAKVRLGSKGSVDLSLTER